MPDRASFALAVGRQIVAPEPLERPRRLLHRILATDPAAWESDEQQLVRWVAERLDSASQDGTRLLLLARDVRCLLDRASSNDRVVLLLELVAERERVLSIVRKYLEGGISRTSFLSFVAEQRWPDEVRRRMAALSKDELVKTMNALQDMDVAGLEAVFTGL